MGAHCPCRKALRLAREPDPSAPVCRALKRKNKPTKFERYFIHPLVGDPRLLGEWKYAW